jgi:repressor LexA
VEQQLRGLQGEIYDFIRRYTREYGRPPTNREIGMEVGIESTGHIDYHLTMLEKKGFIVRERKKSRGIRLAQEEPRGLRIEGTIAAGVPLDIFPDAQQESLDLSLHQREYVLQVRGQSMIDDHIADGDYVLVDREAVINNGDIIVATRKTGDGGLGAATLKRIYREQGRIRLQPANSEMEPIYVPAEEWDRDWLVQGKVTAVYRRC